MSAARQWFTARRKQIILALLLLLAFVAALVLWAGRGDDGESALPPPSGAPTTPVDPSAELPSASGSPSGSASGSGLPGLPGLPGLQLPDSTQLTTLGPGSHRVVLTARSDKPLLAVSYSIKGDSRGKVIYNVKSPVSIARTLSGERPYAAIALQVGPTGSTGSCTITIDGKVVSTQRINAAYAVMQCVG